MSYFPKSSYFIGFLHSDTDEDLAMTLELYDQQMQGKEISYRSYPMCKTGLNLYMLYNVIQQRVSVNLYAAVCPSTCISVRP